MAESKTRQEEQESLDQQQSVGEGLQGESLPIGIDVGSCKIVVCCKRGDEPVARTQLNAFFELPYQRFTQELLDKNQVSYFLENGSVVKHLEGDLLHYSYYTVAEHRQQIENFSTIAARSKFKSGEKSSLLKIWISPAIKFLKCYFIRFGFLEGITGWRICTISARENYKKYQKLKALYKKKQPE